MSEQCELSQIRFSGVPRAEGWDKRANFSFNREKTPDLPEVGIVISEKDSIDVSRFLQADGTLSRTAEPADGRVAFATWKHYTKDSPLPQSGLIGPVTLKVDHVVTI